ncbi:hypothetical protein EYF80_054993 [Liparis tanakae]|uniref:Uncharacterized protein n=1 Tax=Liparis tanakae TaxID=230148 RepID=A0A4Z2F0W4_9TELE|nr:hypothetical protein EYF80_054993 [Liparis tanakae]
MVALLSRSPGPKGRSFCWPSMVITRRPISGSGFIAAGDAGSSSFSSFFFSSFSFFSSACRGFSPGGRGASTEEQVEVSSWRIWSSILLVLSSLMALFVDFTCSKGGKVKGILGLMLAALLLPVSTSTSRLMSTWSFLSSVTPQSRWSKVTLVFRGPMLAWI